MRKYLLTACMIALPLTTNAALFERLGGLAYYDDVADLTWLQDANYAKTSGYDADGRMNWADANSWAAGLDVAGVTGWRLPESDGCYNWSNDFTRCDGSEMGDLYFNVMGGIEEFTLSTYHNANYDLFGNIQYVTYWSGTEYWRDNRVAYDFSMGSGMQVRGDKESSEYAWAVHDGDIGAVPIPAAVWLFGSGFLGLIGIARRKVRA